MMGGGGQLTPIGEEMDSLTQGTVYSACVVVPSMNQVRWYSRLTTAPSLVYDYKLGIWGTWTGVDCVGACHRLSSGTAVLARADGHQWVETVDRWSDGDRPYEMVVRTSNLHPGSAGDFWRVRRWVLFGAGGGVTVRARHFYDDAAYSSETMTIVIPDGNGSTWGDVTWGNGLWGDISSTPELAPTDITSGGDSLFLRDGLFRIRKRPARQKCSVWSLELSDGGVIGPGFSPYLLAVELGKKTGADRAPGAV
jgi:hypothetical protein